MTKRTAPTTTWGTIARVLRDLSLKQGNGQDFRVTGDYRKGERINTLVTLLSDRARTVVFENADAIEAATSTYGFPFYVSVHYFSSGKRCVSLDNHNSGHVREEPPVNVRVTAPVQDTRPPSPDVANDDMLTVCADGRVREIANTTYRSGEPERVRCTDGTEWVAANCMKPQEHHLSPVPDTPVRRTPLEDAASVMHWVADAFREHHKAPSEEYLFRVLEPYFQEARADTLNEALTAVRAEPQNYGKHIVTGDAVRAIKRLKDGDGR